MNKGAITLTISLSLVISSVYLASCNERRAVADVPAPTPAAVSIATANNACALALYDKLRTQEGNLFISPYSISSAMAMVYGGARENTAKEMAKALSLTMEQGEVPAAFKALNATLRANAEKSGHKLSVANGLCLTGDDVDKAFKAMLQDNYDAEIFKGDLAAINEWVKTKTEGKIDKILESLDPDSVCVLLNAIYFKGTWAEKFEKKDTRARPFQVTSDKSVEVPMMSREGDYKLIYDDGVYMLDLPYKGKGASMIILLPKKTDGLAALEKKLSAETLAGWLKKLGTQRLTEAMVFIPKFKMETTYDLVPTFKAMGVKDAFALGSADFSGMGWPKGKLCIAQIKHKAFVEVNEEGTEAAAATAAEMKDEMAPPTFRADHPFLFIIRDNKTDSILFMGRVTDPTK